jgi:hypothetical protein
MNSDFRSFVRSTAFNLTLNASGIDNLLEIYWWERGQALRGYCPWKYGQRISTEMQANYLRRRGMVFKRVSDPGKMSMILPKYCLTRVGIYTSKLLLEAGFKSAPMFSDSEAALDRMFPKTNIETGPEQIRTILEAWGLTDEDRPNAGKFSPVMTEQELKQLS